MDALKFRKETKGEATMNSPKFVRLGIYAVRKAGRALTITLPAEWVDKVGVKQGDDYEIFSLGSELIIRPTGGRK